MSEISPPSARSSELARKQKIGLFVVSCACMVFIGSLFIGSETQLQTQNAEEIFRHSLTGVPAPTPAVDAKTKNTLAWPVTGSIQQAYAKGRNDGVDIGVPPGTPVNAAADGTVAAISEDTNGLPIVVLKHAENLLTIYAYIDELTVAKGDTVTKGQAFAKVSDRNPAILHFEVRDHFESVDPTKYLSN